MLTLREQKKVLRRQILQIRRGIPSDTVHRLSGKMAIHLGNWGVYKEAKTIMLYLSMPDEPQMDTLIANAIADEKLVCVPYCTEGVCGLMDAITLTSMENLIVGKHNIKTPALSSEKYVNPEDIDLIVVPGVAYDLTGRRLGMGAGYYDRFLPRASKAVLIGSAWKEVIVPEVPADKHDFTVEYLLTQDGIIPCSKGKM